MSEQPSLPFEPGLLARMSALEEAFQAWLETEDGQMVVEEFARRAKQVRARGFRHFGAKALWEVIRFDRTVKVGPDAEGYKLNNNYCSRVARLVMKVEPELVGFFETRSLHDGEEN